MAAVSSPQDRFGLRVAESYRHVAGVEIRDHVGAGAAGSGIGDRVARGCNHFHAPVREARLAGILRAVHVEVCEYGTSQRGGELDRGGVVLAGTARVAVAVSVRVGAVVGEILGRNAGVIFRIRRGLVCERPRRSVEGRLDGELDRCGRPRFEGIGAGEKVNAVDAVVSAVQGQRGSGERGRRHDGNGGGGGERCGEIVGNLYPMRHAVADVDDVNPYRRTHLPGIGDASVEGLFRHADHTAAGRFVIVGDGGRAPGVGDRCVTGIAQRCGERLVGFIDPVIDYRNGERAGIESRGDGERTARGGVVGPGFRRAVGGGVCDRHRDRRR